jgi:hypothetical protein
MVHVYACPCMHARMRLGKSASIALIVRVPERATLCARVRLDCLLCLFFLQHHDLCIMTISPLSRLEEAGEKPFRMAVADCVELNVCL